MLNRKINANINKTETLIGANTEFKGLLTSEAGIRIDGAVTGDIQCKGDVTIGNRGFAVSNIVARNITIGGTVHGDVNSNHKLTINAKGKLIGDHSSNSIHIERGGVIVGKRVIRNSLQENS